KTSILIENARPMSGDKKPNKMKDIKKAGIVVHVMFLICANKSTFNIEDAIFVVSESGDILSPKKAPETIAPAVIGSDTSVALDIPINATPMVPTVVKELPTLIPTIADTRNTIAKKNFGVTILNPKKISVGIVPPSIQLTISIPIKKNKNTAAIPVLVPSVMTFSNSLYGTFFIRPQIKSNNNTITNGICGFASSITILPNIIPIIVIVSKTASL